MHKKNLLVTLSDENYLEGAKQVILSAHFNGGWDGDYMLLAYGIPEEKLKWFREKRIIIKKCKPIFKGKIGLFNRDSVNLTKLHIFTLEFKKWEFVLFLDADIIIRHSLGKILNVRRFGCVRESSFLKLKHQFICYLINDLYLNKDKNDLCNILKSNFNVNEKAFNSGVMVINTKIIDNYTFNNLKKILIKYNQIYIHSDQSTFNLFFYKKWESLPFHYNVYVTNLIYKYGIMPEKINGTILHFIGYEKGNKPWERENPFYKEWKSNLDKANFFDKNLIIYSKNIQLKEKLYLKLIIFKTNIKYNFVIGEIGLFLKINYPRIYYFLKDNFL